MAISMLETQVFPSPSESERKAFDISEDIYDGIYNIRALMQVVADCAHNNSVSEDSGFMDGEAISNTLRLALDSLKAVEKNTDELREMQKQEEAELKSLKKKHTKFKLDLLNEKQQKRVIEFAESLID